MYNPFPPVAGGAVGVLAVTGADSIGLAILAILAVVVGLVVIRSVHLKRRGATRGE